MAICLVSDSGPSRLESAAYTSEQELEDIAAADTYLLLADDEPDLHLISDRKIHLRGSGISDLIFLDATGHLTVVEVKLRKNIEHRRTVVGQVFDYVSTLADMNVDDLDNLTRGRLKSALRELGKAEADDTSYEEIHASCRKFLREGDIRVVVLMDSPSDELVRIMAFINDHSDLDVRLISIQKHEQEGGQVYVPRMVVLSTGEKTVEKRSPRPMRPELAGPVGSFDRQQPHGLSTTGKASSYRQIRLPDWPEKLHYEFWDSGETINVEFHVEDKAFGSFVRVLRELEMAVKEAIPQHEVYVNPRRWKGLGGIAVVFPDTATADEIAHGMALLIETTRPWLDKEIKARISAK